MLIFPLTDGHIKSDKTKYRGEKTYYYGLFNIPNTFKIWHANFFFILFSSRKINLLTKYSILFKNILTLLSPD